MQFSLLAPADDQLRALIAVGRDLDVEVLAYSPLALGVLGCVPGAEERRPVTWLRRRLFRRLLPASLELRNEIQAIAIERGASMVQVALNWCRACGTTPIPGLRTPEQARDVAAALQWSMSPQERQRLDTARLGAASGCPPILPESLSVVLRPPKRIQGLGSPPPGGCRRHCKSE